MMSTNPSNGTGNAALGALINNLGALVPLGAALVAIVFWLNGQFSELRDRQSKIDQAVRELIWCVNAQQGNPNFRCATVPPL